MPNSSYARGAAFERKVKDYLESNGWFASRSAGSHGLTDVVALAPIGPREGDYQMTRVVLIQCKTGKAKMSKKERELLTRQALAYNASAYELSPTGIIHIAGPDVLFEWFAHREDTPWQNTPQQ